jgi:hypothetical protein
MKAQVICIEGRWKDDRKSFEYRCLIMPKGASDSVRDEILKDVGDDSLFYIFEEGEQIVGEHLDFVVDFYNPLWEIEVGELQ